MQSSRPIPPLSGSTNPKDSSSSEPFPALSSIPIEAPLACTSCGDPSRIERASSTLSPWLRRLDLQALHRDPEREGGSRVRLGGESDCSAVVVDCPVGDRETLPGPGADRFGGEELVEDA